MTDYKNPWKTIDSQVKYQNPWIKVREDKVIQPNGKEGVYGVVTPKDAVGVLAIDGDEVYLVGQFRYPMGQYSWEIIEGGVEPGEDHLATAKRELEEEAGIIAASWSTLGHEIHLSNCYTDEKAYLFLATELSPGIQQPDETEVLSVKKVKITQALEMVRSGEIKDGLSIIALLSYLP